MLQRQAPSRGFAWRGVLAAAVLVQVAGCVGVAGPSAPTASPSTPVPTTTAPPVAQLGVADIGRSLAAGSYRVADPFGVALTFSVAEGWKLDHLDQGEVGIVSSDRRGWVVVDLVENVFADPCQSRGGPRQPPVGPTTAELVAALTSMVGFKAGPITDISVGGRAGTAFGLSNEIRTQSAGCYGVDMLPLWTARGGTPVWTAGGVREQIWVLDVEGTPVIVDRGGPGADAVAESFEFGTPVAWTPRPQSPAPTGPGLSYVALGDSLLFAAREDCNGCTSAAAMYGEQLATDLETPVNVHNLTMHNSLTSTMLLGYFERGARVGRDPEDLFDAVAGADIISLTIGFNDASSPDPGNIPALVKAFGANLEGILGHIDALRAGKPTAIRVTNIYNNGGTSWTQVVEAMNQVICDVAARHDAVCVDIYRPFMGPDGTSDPVTLGYLGEDRTHPSQLGMEVIAAALIASGPAALR